MRIKLHILPPALQIRITKILFIGVLNKNSFITFKLLILRKCIYLCYETVSLQKTTIYCVFSVWLSIKILGRIISSTRIVWLFTDPPICLDTTLQRLYWLPATHSREIRHHHRFHRTTRPKMGTHTMRWRLSVRVHMALTVSLYSSPEVGCGLLASASRSIAFAHPHHSRLISIYGHGFDFGRLLLRLNFLNDSIIVLFEPYNGNHMVEPSIHPSPEMECKWAIFGVSGRPSANERHVPFGRSIFRFATFGFSSRSERQKSSASPPA